MDSSLHNGRSIREIILRVLDKKTSIPLGNRDN